MLSPNEEVLRSIISLASSNPGAFKVFKDWISNSWIGHLMVSSRIEQESTLRWMQGRCQELEDLGRFMATAQEQLDKIQKAAVASATPAPNTFD